MFLAAPVYGFRVVPVPLFLCFCDLLCVCLVLVPFLCVICCVCVFLFVVIVEKGVDLVCLLAFSLLAALLFSQSFGLVFFGCVLCFAALLWLTKEKHKENCFSAPYRWFSLQNMETSVFLSLTLSHLLLSHHPKRCRDELLKPGSVLDVLWSYSADPKGVV